MSIFMWSGLIVGILFGFALQRGRFCMNSAFRDTILLKDFTLLKAVLLAMLVEMIGWGVMQLAGVIVMGPPALSLGANIIGGLIFGVGMAIAGGCASGITYRFGEGMVGAMTAVIGFSMSALATRAGILVPLAAPLKTLGNFKAADGSPVTLANMVGLPYWAAALAIALVAIVVWVIVARRHHEENVPAEKASLAEKIFKRGWSWMVAGIVIGLIGVISFPLSEATGRNYPLGITAGWVAILQTIVTPQVTIVNWGALLIVGAVIGAIIAAVIAGEFKLRAPTPAVLIQTFFGGALMGFGSTVAGGCNIGHILSGVPQLSVGSIISGAGIVMGSWITVYFLFMRQKGTATSSQPTIRVAPGR